MADGFSESAIFTDGIAVYTAALQAGHDQKPAIRRNGASADPTAVYRQRLCQRKSASLLIDFQNTDGIRTVEHIIDPLSTGMHDKTLLLQGHKAIGGDFCGFAVEPLPNLGCLVAGNVAGQRGDGVDGSQLAIFGIGEGGYIHVALMVVIKERQGRVESAVPGSGARGLGIGLAGHHQLFVFIIQPVEVDVGIPLVTAGKEGPVRTWQDRMGPGMEPTALHHVRFMVVNVYHGTDGAVRVQTEQAYGTVVIDTNHMVKTIVTFHGLGDHIEAGMVCQKQVFSGFVKRQETGAGGRCIDPADLR